MRVYELEAGACAGAGAAVALLTAAANECLIDVPFKRISNFVAIMVGNRYCVEPQCNYKI